MPTFPSDHCPCDGCQRRHEACHDNCELYQAWKYQRSEVLAKMRAERDAYTDKEKQPYWHKYRRDNKRGQK